MADVCEIGPSATSRLAGPLASESRLAIIGDLPLLPYHSSLVRRITKLNLSAHALRRANLGGQEHGLEGVIPEVNGCQVGTSL